MPTRPFARIQASEITPETLFHRRRDFLKRAAAAGIAALTTTPKADCGAVPGNLLLPGDQPNTYEEITGYKTGASREFTQFKMYRAVLQKLLRHPIKTYVVDVACSSSL